MPLEKKQRGRPAREPMEVARTARWYDFVRETSNWTEFKLEVTFDKLDRQEGKKHRSSRWNKYRFGRASPGRELLLRVEERFPGTLGAYDHPMWELATRRTMSSQEFRNLIRRLPWIQAALVDPESRPESLFWIRCDSDHRSMVRAMLALERTEPFGHSGALTGLLALIHDAVNRQREEQHFECHVALAKAASYGYGLHPNAVYTWRLESIVLGRWLETEYTRRQFREVVESMRRVAKGPVPPWMPKQPALGLVEPSAHRNAAERQERRGFWVGQKLLKMAGDYGLADIP
jgi:hypothetical protein